MRRLPFRGSALTLMPIANTEQRRRHMTLTQQRPDRAARRPAGPRFARRRSQASPDAVLAFAQAVAEPGELAWALMANNASGKRLSVAAAAAGGEPFFVRHAEYFVVIDMDDPERLEALTALAEEVQSWGCVPVMLK